MASRFGARGETDLGNGMTGFGRYEWDVDFDSSAGIKNRHRYVGVKGDWGSVLLGQTYHTFYNFVVGPTDMPWWGSGYAMVNYRGRTDNAITYAGGGGAINFGVSLYMEDDADEEDIDTIEAGISFGVGDLGTIAVAMQAFQGDDDITSLTVDEEEEIIGVTWSGIGIGDTTLGIGYQTQDDDDSILLDWMFGNFYVHAETVGLDAVDADPTSITLGYTQSLGRNTTMWYEVQAYDADDSFTVKDVNKNGLLDTGDTLTEVSDATYIRAVLKYDIL